LYLFSSGGLVPVPVPRSVPVPVSVRESDKPGFYRKFREILNKG
jgi:hypothetical protein